jgi:hypothetical protein
MMNTMRQILAVVLNIAFVFLAINALFIVLGFIANPLFGSGHGHWALTSLAVIVTIALRTVVWLLPFIVIMLLIGALMGNPQPTADQSEPQQS